MNNNPVRYSDPSGHANECGYTTDTHCGVGAGPIMPVQISYSDPSDANEEVKQIEIEYSWDYLPSAIGRNFGVYFQGGIFI